MARSFPTGWFESDLLWWGEGLSPSTCFSRGALVEVPDMRSADVRTLLELRAGCLQMLAALGNQAAVQVHWTVEDDFKGDLRGYSGRDAGSEWARRTRAIRRSYYERRITEGSLRRERVHVYLGQRCSDLAGDEVRSQAQCRAYLRQCEAGIAARMRSLETTLPISRWTLLGNAGHAVHMRKLLNPSMVQFLSGDQTQALAGFDPSQSIRANCLRSDIDAFAYGSGPAAHNLLYFDGMYHALFVLRELPHGTRPGMLLPVLDAMDRGFCITLNIQPLSVESEIDRLRREIVELSAFLKDPKAIGVENDIQSRRSRIDSLLSSVTIPFQLLFLIRVWDTTIEGLSAKSLGLKAALHRLDGAEFMQVNGRAQARHLFYETLPGNLGSGYRGWDVYVENRNLADLLPLSSTFTGHLEEAQALYDSPSGGLVGIRLLAEGSAPQHSIVVGVNGSGKSSLLIDLMSQSDPHWTYRFFQEEGMAYVTLAQLTGMQSLVLRESSELTLNPFDTFGLPLSSANISGVVKTCMKLIGASRDEDRNKRREGLIGEYVHGLFEGYAEDWKNADEDRWYRLARRTLAAEGLRKGDDDLLDAHLEFSRMRREEPARAEEIEASLSEAAVVAYMTGSGRRSVSAAVFSEFDREQFPQFDGLVSLLRHGRKSHHRSAGLAEELDYLSSELAKGRRMGGVVGAFLDGATNVDIRGSGLHFDTSRLPEGPLKEVAGFTVFQRVRQHILSLPRSCAKVMLLDELRRVLLIPGACEFVKELLAQMRKYRCVFIGAFQEPSQIDDIDPNLTDLLFGQCKQYFLMRQNNSDQVRRLARAIGLPPTAQRAICQHPLVEHQKTKPKAAYCTYFSRQAGTPLCGTVRVEVDPYMLYVAESTGATFESRMKAMKRYPSVLEGVLAEAVQSP